MTQHFSQQSQNRDYTILRTFSLQKQQVTWKIHLRENFPLERKY